VAAVYERSAWIASSLEHFSAQRAVWLADPGTLLPQRVHFVATGEAWAVEYRRTASASVRAGIVDGVLVVSGGICEAMSCLHALQRWLQRMAVERLVPRLNELAEASQLTLLGAGVRGQYGRWGGCSQRGFITLNRALLFLEPHLVDAVIHHELAHLPHPNHSPRFWQELARLDPNMPWNRAAIGAAWDRVPGWAERR
jgi:predicted metal-dependent hydrolase